jgi:hypothetical protein
MSWDREMSGGLSYLVECNLGRETGSREKSKVRGSDKIFGISITCDIICEWSCR